MSELPENPFDPEVVAREAAASFGNGTFDETLHFVFKIGETVFRPSYTKPGFAALDTAVKLVNIIGHTQGITQRNRNFEETDEYYFPLLTSVVNKGRKKREQLSPEAVKELIGSLIDQGCISNGGTRYELQPPAATLVNQKPSQAKAKQNTLAKQQDEPVEKPEITEALMNIEPNHLPIHSSWENDQLESDVARLEFEAKKVEKEGFANLEVLSALEFAGGVIEVEKSRQLGAKLRELSGSMSDTGNLKKAVKALSDGAKRYIIASKDGRKIELTTRGEEFIAVAKLYPQYTGPKEVPTREKTDEADRTDVVLMEKIMDLLGISYEQTVHGLDPDGKSDWLLPVDSKQNVAKYLVGQIDKPILYDTAARALRKARESKYVEADENGDNIRMLPEGIRYMRDRYWATLADAGEMSGHDELMDELEELIVTCKEFAGVLKDSSVLTDLEERYDNDDWYRSETSVLHTIKDDLNDLFSMLRARRVAVLRPIAAVAEESATAVRIA